MKRIRTGTAAVSVCGLMMVLTLGGCAAGLSPVEESDAASTGQETVSPAQEDMSASGSAAGAAASASISGSSAGTASSASVTQEDILGALRGVVCWGDSLTYGRQTDDTNYPEELRGLIDSRLIEPIREKTGDTSLTAPEVVNLGVNTETTLEIAGRNGGIPLMVSADFTIPSGTEPVDFEYCSSERHSETKLLRESDGGVTTVTIDGIEGKLIRWYDVEADHSRYKFQRLREGDPVSVHAGDLMLTNLYDEYLEYCPIIMMGANGGWSDDTDLAQQFQAMITHSESEAWLIAATPLSSETDAAVMDQEDSDMAEAFGSRAVSLRGWMMEEGLRTAGITPTAGDEQRIAAGLTPSSLLLEDLLHFTPAGYRAMAEMFYEQMETLGYFDELKALAR